MKRVIYLFLLSFLTSCLKIDCEELKKVYENEECILVVQEPPEKSSWFKVKGYDPKTKKNCECKSVNRCGANLIKRLNLEIL